MEAVIKKWGNSLGIRIPNLIIRELSLKEGSFVDIKDKGNEIIIKPKNNLNPYTYYHKNQVNHCSV